MYVIAIAWLYVALMAALADGTIMGGILTFIFYGLAPLALFMWLFGTRARHRAQAARLKRSGDDSNHEKNGDQ